MSNVSAYSGFKLDKIDKEIDRLPQPRDERAKGLPHQPDQRKVKCHETWKETAYRIGVKLLSKVWCLTDPKQMDNRDYNKKFMRLNIYIHNVSKYTIHL
jgi:hypothetical protein